MAYRYQKNPNTGQSELVIDGFEKGIAESPYEGIADIRNVNLISIPAEADINFSLSKVSQAEVGTGTVTSADPATDIITFTGATGLTSGMAIIFSGGSLPTGITAGLVYWIEVVSATTIKIYSDLIISNLINITATGTGTFTIPSMGVPKDWTYASRIDTYWIIDSNGRVWTNSYSGVNFWQYAGNTTLTNASGNGICYYLASNDSTDYIIIFRNGLIDYQRAANTLITNSSWVYGWNPADGSTGNTSTVLHTSLSTNSPHKTLLGPSKTLYYVDASYVSSWFENSGQIFNPTNTATYTFAYTAIQTEQNDLNNCLALLGNNLLVGGSRENIYVWDRSSLLYQYRIQLAESNISMMVTINTSTYIFTGNRGRIYITNGSQAKLYKKIPDALSDTVEPYFLWGGAGSIKNQLYFGIRATNNAGTQITKYGGVWAIDTDTDALRLTNILSYGTYAGTATVIIPRIIPIPPNTPSNSPGSSLFVGWNDGTSYSGLTPLTFNGIDSSSSTLYTNWEPYVISDLIPIGTYLGKKTFSQIEFKLTTPMVASEGVRISCRTYVNDSWTLISTTLYSATADTNLSDVYTVTFEKGQWIQLKVELLGAASSPSYTRLRELRIR